MMGFDKNHEPPIIKSVDHMDFPQRSAPIKDFAVQV